MVLQMEPQRVVLGSTHTQQAFLTASTQRTSLIQLLLVQMEKLRPRQKADVAQIHTESWDPELQAPLPRPVLMLSVSPAPTLNKE